MSAQQHVAAPGLLARREAVSPWQAAASPTSAARRWLGRLAEAWREGMALYLASAHRGRWTRF